MAQEPTERSLDSTKDQLQGTVGGSQDKFPRSCRYFLISFSAFRAKVAWLTMRIYCQRKNRRRPAFPRVSCRFRSQFQAEPLQHVHNHAALLTLSRIGHTKALTKSRLLCFRAVEGSISRRGKPVRIGSAFRRTQPKNKTLQSSISHANGLLGGSAAELACLPNIQRIPHCELAQRTDESSLSSQPCASLSLKSLLCSVKYGTLYTSGS